MLLLKLMLLLYLSEYENKSTFEILDKMAEKDMIDQEGGDTSIMLANPLQMLWMRIKWTQLQIVRTRWLKRQRNTYITVNNLSMS